MGKQVFCRIIDNLVVYPVPINALVTKNGVMVTSSAKPHPKREQFYELVDRYSIDEAMSLIEPISKIDVFVEKLKRLFAKTKLIILLKKIKREHVKIVRS